MELQQVQLIKIRSPLDHRRRMVEFKECDSLCLLDIRNREVPKDIGFTVSVNGIVVREEDYALTQVKPHDCIIFTPQIEGDFGGILRAVLMIAIIVGATYLGGWAFAAVAPETLVGMTIAQAETAFALASIAEALTVMGTVLVGSLLVNAILPSSMPPMIEGGFDRSQTYSWNPITTQQQGSAIPIIYGKHRTYGNIISGYIDYGEGISIGNQKLNLLISLGMGPIKAITNIRINDQVSGFYSGLELHTRLGLLNQNDIPSSNGAPVTYHPGREVRADSLWTAPYYVTPDDDFDGLEIVLSFPRGVFYANDAGSLSVHTIKVSIEIRNVTLGESFRHVGFTSLSELQVAVGYRWSFGLWMAPFINPMGGENYEAPTWRQIADGGTDPTAHTEGETNEPTYPPECKWRWIGPEVKYDANAPENAITVAMAEASAFTYTKKLSGLSHGQYAIRIIKISADNDNVRYGDKVTLGSVIEVYNNVYRYPRIALVGIEALASDQISGSIKFSADVYGKLIQVYRVSEVLGTDGKNYRCIQSHVANDSTRPTTGYYCLSYWEQIGHSALPLVEGNAGIAWGNGNSYSATPSWRTEYSDNPAWIALDILTQPVFNDGGFSVNRHDAYDLSYLDISTFQTWADYCDTLVDDGVGGLERRITYNGVIDSMMNVWDAVIAVCQMSYACPIWTGTTIKIIVDQARSSTQLFTIGNIIEDSFKEVFLSVSERAGELEVEFTDKEQDYDRTVLTIVDTTADRPSNKANKALFGITKSSEANRLGHRYLAYNKYQIRLIDWEADVDAIVCELGDRVDLSHDVPQWGFGGRVISATSNTVTLDRTIEIAAGKTGSDYTIKVRLTNDAIVTKTLHSTMSPGEYTVITISGTFTTGIPEQFDPYVVGLSAIVVKPVIVVGLRKTSDQTVGITAVDYYDEVYDFESGKVYETVLNYSALSRLVVIVSVTAMEFAHINESGAIVREVYVDFTVGSNAICKGAVVTVMKLVSGGGGAVVAVLSTTTRRAIFTGAQPATTYAFIVQGINSANEYSPKSVAGDHNIVTITTSAVVNYTAIINARITGLQIFEGGNSNEFVGKDCKFVWNPIDVVISGDVGAGEEPVTSNLLFKDYEVKICNIDGTVRRMEYVQVPTYTYTYEMNSDDGDVTRSFEIRVKARDIFLQTSEDSRLSVTNPAPRQITAEDNYLTIRPGINCFIIEFYQFFETLELDVRGYMVWASELESFTPSALNLQTTSTSSVQTINVDRAGTWYVRVAAYDVFGAEELNYSYELSVDVGRWVEYNDLELELMKMNFQAVSWAQFAIFDDFANEAKRYSPEPATYPCIIYKNSLTGGGDTPNRAYGFMSKQYVEVTTVETGTSTSVGVGFLTDTNKSWFIDQCKLLYLRDSTNEEFIIQSNTSNTLTVTGRYPETPDTPAAGAYKLFDDNPTYAVCYCTYEDLSNGGAGYTRFEVSFDGGGHWKTVLDTETGVDLLEGTLEIEYPGVNYIVRFTLTNGAEGAGPIVYKYLICTDPSPWRS